ncbi:MAG: DNA repair protein RecN [Alphaproteobacteria bacterium]|nr:DNA repair protein RecN [Alphaproteobacteria bacterium]
MLTNLTIRDVVLIDKLELCFADGLCVFTGETGAGKSILLDSLALAIGARSDTGLIRNGAKNLSVTAEFDKIPQSVLDMLSEQSIDYDSSENLVLRRNVNIDGKSKAYINDQPVSIGFLKQIGEELIEIHGQFATHSLLNPVSHRSILDAYGELENLKEICSKSYEKWQNAVELKKSTLENLDKARQEQDFIKHSLDELVSFNPTIGEEDALAERRSVMMNSEKIAENLTQVKNALDSEELGKTLRTAERNLENLSRIIPNKFDQIIDLIDNATNLLNEASSIVNDEYNSIDYDANEQSNVEERLFALRSLARKHQVQCDELPSLLEDFKNKLNAIESGTDNLLQLESEEKKAKEEYLKAAQNLSDARKQAAKKLDTSVKLELEPLKLGKARFLTLIEQLSENLYSRDGFDKVSFCAATNAGQELSPINKIASGGELARFMLALKVNLATAENIPTMIFDEVDAAIGGATANAVGERLSKLSHEKCQVLVITHSPQVAAYGQHHFRVQKSDTADNKTITNVVQLSKEERINEIARMLSGSNITEASKLASIELLSKH